MSARSKEAEYLQLAKLNGFQGWDTTARHVLKMVAIEIGGARNMQR